MTSLLNKRLILVCGKGGVGRSTVALSLALAAAAAGRKTLLFETNANDRFGPYLDKPAVGSELVQLAPRIFAVNTNPAAALAEYGLMILKFQAAYEMIFENRVTKSFLRAVPGLDDYALLGKAWFHSTEMQGGKPTWDTIIFDMPASGHAMSMLRIPKAIIETVPESPLTRDAHKIIELIANPQQTAAVIVTLAEEMPANEARELADKLKAELGIAPQLVVANQIYPGAVDAAPTAAILNALEAAPPSDPAWLAMLHHGLLMRDRYRLNQTYLHELRTGIAAPLVELPMRFGQRLSPADLLELGQRLVA